MYDENGNIVDLELLKQSYNKLLKLKEKYYSTVTNSNSSFQVIDCLNNVISQFEIALGFTKMSEIYIKSAIYYGDIIKIDVSDKLRGYIVDNKINIQITDELLVPKELHTSHWWSDNCEPDVIKTLKVIYKDKNSFNVKIINEGDWLIIE